MTRTASEALLLVLVVCAPWLFGAVQPQHEALLYYGIAGLLVLWGCAQAVHGVALPRVSTIGICLAAMVLLAAWQLMPLEHQSLARVSPATATLYGRLLPEQPEVLASGEVADAHFNRAGSTISLYPAATRAQLVRLLAVFLLFMVVRTAVASPDSFRRLSLVAMANGFLLAVFALTQHFLADGDTIYGRYPTAGSSFGPFVNRNHFGFYMNLCIGMGIGLLVGRLQQHSAKRRRSWSWLLEDSTLLWIIFALGVMIASVFFSLTRGGIAALLALILTAVLLPWTQRRGRWHAAPVAGLLIAIIAASFLLWFGLDPLLARLDTVWQGQALESRLALWDRSLPLLRDFFAWGSGFGTFSHVEPLYRTQYEAIVYEHAENSYIESFAEGGVLQLGLSLAVVGLMLFYAYRIFTGGVHSAGSSSSSSLSSTFSCRGIALGGLCSTLSAAIHSGSDFGIHIPAIALLATVIAAQLEGAARGVPSPHSARAGRFIGFVLLVVACLLALLLSAAGRQMSTAERHWRNARLIRDNPRMLDLTGLVRELTRANAAVPGDAGLAIELAQAHYALHEYYDREQPENHRGELHLEAALRHYIRARNLFPLQPIPHVRIATNAEYLQRTEPVTVHLARAKLLNPADPELWFASGLAELNASQPETAWRSWRRSLEISDRFLPQILDLSSVHLSAMGIADTVVPDRPALLLAAATHAYPGASGGRQPLIEDQQRRLLERLLHLLNRQATLTADELAVKAQAHERLGQTALAMEAYEQALGLKPEQAQWRMQLAQLYMAAADIDAARLELRRVLIYEPAHAGAIELLKGIARLKAEREVQRRGMTEEREG